MYGAKKNEMLYTFKINTRRKKFYVWSKQSAIAKHERVDAMTFTQRRVSNGKVMWSKQIGAANEERGKTQMIAYRDEWKFLTIDYERVDAMTQFFTQRWVSNGKGKSHVIKTNPAQPMKSVGKLYMACRDEWKILHDRLSSLARLNQVNVNHTYIKLFSLLWKWK